MAHVDICDQTGLLPDECGCRLHAKPSPKPKGNSGPQVGDARRAGAPWLVEEDLAVIDRYFEHHGRVPRHLLDALDRRYERNAGTFLMRHGNVEWVVTDGRRGLSNAAKQTVRLVEARLTAGG